MEHMYLQAAVAIAKRWKLLSALLVIAGAGSLSRELIYPPTYEAEIILNISDVIVGERRTFANLEGSGANNYAVSSGFANKLPMAGTQDQQLMNSIADGPTVVKDMLESTSVIGQLREVLQERGAFSEGQAPGIGDLQNRLTAEVNVIDQTTRPVTYSPMLILHAVGRTEEEARTLVETWAEIGVRATLKVARLRTEPITKALSDEEARLKVALSAVLAETTALESEPGEAQLSKELECVLTTLAERQSAVAPQAEVAGNTEIQAEIAHLESKRNELQKRIAEYHEKRDWLDIREQVARETYIGVAENLVMAETARRIAVSATADGESAVGLNSLLDHAYAKEKRGLLGKKERVVTVTFVTAVLAAVCIVTVDVVLPVLRDFGQKSRK